jgi:hypothetical protein
LPDDPLISRRHFMVEVNPPDARIRDFGSLNGTYVNDTKIGSRERGETPEQGQKRKCPEGTLRTVTWFGRGTQCFRSKSSARRRLGRFSAPNAGKTWRRRWGGGRWAPISARPADRA